MNEKLYFNDPSNSELTNRIFELINNATTYIKTANFFFKDIRLNKALIDAAKRGVAVFVLSNLTGNENRDSVKTNSRIENDPHITHLHELYRYGVHIHLCDDLHAKFLITDGQKGLIMSANYTPDSLYGNPENGVDIQGLELIDLEFVFDKLYIHCDRILSEDMNRYRYINHNSPIPQNAFSEIGKNNKLLLTASSKATNLKNCNITSIYQNILDIINTAEEGLVIVSYSYNQIRLIPEFKRAIHGAIQRGVKITLFYGTKGTEHQQERTNLQLMELLGSEGFMKMAVAFKENHAKCIISEKKGAIFTANIDGAHGLTNGLELGCELSEEQRIQTIRRINQIIENGK